MREVVKSRIESMQALVQGDHFVYKSGRHGPDYFDKNKLLIRPQITNHMGQALADECTKCLAVTTKLREIPEVVVGPAMGGAVFSSWLGFHLENLTRPSCTVYSVFAEKKGADNFELTRGFDLVVSGKNVIVTEDVINTGGSTKGVIEVVESAGGRVIGVAAIVNRSASTVTAETLGVPFLATVLDLDLLTWSQDECPLCRDKVPVNEILGHGKEFMDKQRARKLMAMQMS